jgi:hypothetical protein
VAGASEEAGEQRGGGIVVEVNPHDLRIRARSWGDRTLYLPPYL